MIMLKGSPGRRRDAAHAAFTTAAVAPPAVPLHDAHAPRLAKFGPTFGYFPPGG